MGWLNGSASKGACGQAWPELTCWDPYAKIMASHNLSSDFHIRPVAYAHTLNKQINILDYLAITGMPYL